MKKLFLCIFTTLLVGLVSVASLVSAQQSNYSFVNQNTSNAPTLPWSPGATLSINANYDPLAWADWIIAKISSVINWVLGLLALVSIIILIYTGVKMLLNASDDKAIDEWYKTVKNIFIALLFIGASWLIVKFIFYVIWLLAK